MRKQPAPAGTPKGNPYFSEKKKNLRARPNEILASIFNKGKLLRLEIIKKGGIGLHMGRYGLILCANESYTNNLAIGINFDPIPAYTNIEILNILKTKKIPKYIKFYVNSRPNAIEKSNVPGHCGFDVH